METRAVNKPVEYAGIRFSADAVCGIQGGRVYSVIPHAEVQRVVLHHGSVSAHPVIQLVVGLVLAAAGVPVLIHMVHWAQKGGTIVSPEALFMTFPAVGVILLFTALRRGHYLMIERQRGCTKLGFDSSAKLEQVRAFINEARLRARFPIEIDPGIPR